ncbi:succinate dehydrogenase, cytochrome b556 subunit [Sphingomonas jatrophae]|uniref:Succinate dehydrogenase cytochrome b556 subunit n=1 Tax=Sphingomonas jatrophae TaxID=1166337 RepID=A0A1I6LDN8_9SPHN|nr:succinate dehydrogenase, cytochrome b556 subunit [Sphingomonas jatrophae]SFS01557.1 succinate dehydrogenase subunit C [Sphingomonas jatrophae]
MARPRSRPLSPHLTIWRWGPHMLVSILHRATGVGLALGGATLFTWWLAAAAGGPASYARFLDLMTRDQPIGPDGLPLPGTAMLNPLPALILIGLTWAFFQHMANGIRHLVMDLGAAYELKTNKTTSLATIAFSIIATLLLWAWIFTR